MTTNKGTSRPDYGIDAPGVRRGMLMAGCGGLAVAVLAGAIGLPAGVGKWISIIGFMVAAYGLFMGAYMTYGSRSGKEVH